MNQARIDKALSQLDADAANDYAVLRSNGVSEADALAAVSDTGYIIGDGGKGGAVASPVGRYTGTGLGFVDGLDFGAQRMLDDLAALSARVNESWEAATAGDAFGAAESDPAYDVFGPGVKRILRNALSDEAQATNVALILRPLQWLLGHDPYTHEDMTLATYGIVYRDTVDMNDPRIVEFGNGMYTP